MIHRRFGFGHDLGLRMGGTQGKGVPATAIRLAGDLLTLAGVVLTLAG
jgi:hypothetical protein